MKVRQLRRWQHSTSVCPSPCQNRRGTAWVPLPVFTIHLFIRRSALFGLASDADNCFAMTHAPYHTAHCLGLLAAQPLSFVWASTRPYESPRYWEEKSIPFRSPKAPVPRTIAPLISYACSLWSLGQPMRHDWAIPASCRVPLYSSFGPLIPRLLGALPDSSFRLSTNP
jgi:hypothetical protein